MADPQKTEKATPKQREKARKKGQVAKSQDLGTATVLVAGLIGLSAFGAGIVTTAGTAMTMLFHDIAHPNEVASGAGLNGIGHLVMNSVIQAVAPIAAICAFAGIALNVAQVGFHPSLQALRPDVKRVNPMTGFRNIFGPRLAFETFKQLAKVAAVGALVALALLPQLTQLAGLVGMSPTTFGQVVSSNSMSIAEHAAIAFLLIGLIDYAWQRRRHEESLKMTKQSVKDEAKEAQLPAEVRAQLRRRQAQAARTRMMAAVPQADVVVTNPTHYAVALKYDGVNPAPEVIAKGKDLIAAQIRHIAQENDVPIVPNPPLARALHGSVEIGQLIPEELYEAVAQVLAFVYRMARRKKGLM